MKDDADESSENESKRLNSKNQNNNKLKEAKTLCRPEGNRGVS